MFTFGGAGIYFMSFTTATAYLNFTNTFGAYHPYYPQISSVIGTIYFDLTQFPIIPFDQRRLGMHGDTNSVIPPPNLHH